MFAALLQDPNLDYSSFRHNSQRHASLACTTCHERRDNSATPRFPGHKACTSCHLAQFVTPNVPMCVICHTDVNSSNPPLKSFPTKFNESFNVKFDHCATHDRVCSSVERMFRLPQPRRRPRSGARDSQQHLGSQPVLHLSHAEQQISSGTRNCFVRSLSRSEIVWAYYDQRALFSLCVQPRQTWRRSKVSLRRLPSAICRRTADATGERAGSV